RAARLALKQLDDGAVVGGDYGRVARCQDVDRLVTVAIARVGERIGERRILDAADGDLEMTATQVRERLEADLFGARRRGRGLMHLRGTERRAAHLGGVRRRAARPLHEDRDENRAGEKADR